jgi:hypothetical protein
MPLPTMIDEERPYGKTLGDDEVCFKQDGYDFNSKKELIKGSKNSGKDRMAEAMEKAGGREPVEFEKYEDMHVQELKRRYAKTIEELDELEVEYEAVPLGAGIKKRLIEFLNDYAP